MAKPNAVSRSFLLLIVWYFCFIEFDTSVSGMSLGENPVRQAHCQVPFFSALYIFGDSTVDPGNNNNLVTVVKANFPPYGRDFPNGIATGRFTNGKLVTDYISSLFGVSEILPAYLDPDFNGMKLLTGASFASSGSGYNVGTSAEFLVFPLEKQFEFFKEYKSRLTNLVGQANATRIIDDAAFAVSTGADDFLLNYNINPLTRVAFSVEEYQNLLLQGLRRFITNVHGEGAKRLVIIGLPPFGCLPVAITLFNLVGNTCVEEFNNVARSTNSKIIALIEEMEERVPGLVMMYGNAYDTFDTLIKNGRQYGFTETRKGCCGTGLVEAAILCNVNSGVCEDDSAYLFWDAVHPSSRAYQYIAVSLTQQILRQYISDCQRV